MMKISKPGHFHLNENTLDLPQISIITPSFNQGDFIETTIKSVLSQDYPNLEYIVIDGGSDDGTVEILKKYNSRIIWVSEPDDGQSDAMNKGVSLATGEIIGVLNSDDYYEEDALKKVGLYFKNNSQVSWLVGRKKFVDAQGEEIRHLVTSYKNFWLRFKLDWVLFILNFIPHQATFLRRELVSEVGEFDKSLYYTMDYDYWLRVKEITKLRTIPEHLANLRLHSKSKSNLGFIKQFDEEKIVLKKHQVNLIFSSLHLLHNWLIKTSYSIEHFLRNRIT